MITTTLGILMIITQGSPTPEAKASVLASHEGKFGDKKWRIDLKVRSHSVRPEGYEKDDPEMRGDLLEVEKSTGDEKPVVIWRRFIPNGTLRPELRRWTAALCKAPGEDEVCIAMSTGQWPMAFRIKLTNRPEAAPVLPKDFATREPKAPSIAEQDKHLLSLGFIGLTKDVWAPVRELYFNARVEKLALDRRDDAVVLTVDAKTDRESRFRFDWKSQKWNQQKAE